MPVSEVLQAVRVRWRIALMSFLVVLIGFVAYAVIARPDYTANLSMYVSAQVGDNAQALYQGSLLSEQRVVSYVDLISSPRVLDQAAAATGGRLSPDELSQQVTATTKPDSVLLNVEVRDKSPLQAAAVANAIGDYFPRLVDEIERPQRPQAQPPVIVRVVQPAIVPLEASSPHWPYIVGLGALVGLVLALVTAVAADRLDSTIRSVRMFKSASTAPNFGAIPRDEGISSTLLTASVSHDSRRTLEAFRQLRTNLEFADIDNPPKVIVITSSLEGEGKTTVACNLASVLSAAGSRVLLIDADLRRPRAANYLGLSDDAGLTAVLSHRARVADLLQRSAAGFDFLASGQIPPNPSELLGSRQMREVLARFRDSYDYVVVDAPPLLPVTDAAALAPATDGVILTARFGTVKAEQVRSSVGAIEAVSGRILGTVLNQIPDREASGYYGIAYGSYYTSPSASPSADDEATTTVVMNRRASHSASSTRERQTERS